jgi:hypothetical protein
VKNLATTDLVAIILATGMVVALNAFIVAAAVEAYANAVTLPIGLSDNATQVLTGWGGGLIGVIGALVGMRIGRTHPGPEREEPPEG